MESVNFQEVLEKIRRNLSPSHQPSLPCKGQQERGGLVPSPCPPADPWGASGVRRGLVGIGGGASAYPCEGSRVPGVMAVRGTGVSFGQAAFRDRAPRGCARRRGWDLSRQGTRHHQPFAAATPRAGPASALARWRHRTAHGRPGVLEDDPVPRKRKERPCRDERARRLWASMDPFDRAAARLAGRVDLALRQRPPPR
jgi:hypothetical protein